MGFNKNSLWGGLSVPPIFSDRRRLVLIGKLHRTRNNCWKGVGECIARGETYRVLATRWFPPGTFLVSDSVWNDDYYFINSESTIDRNGYSYEWLDEHEPKELFPPLFPEIKDWLEDKGSPGSAPPPSSL